jgi:hypothetical protein
MMQQKHYHLEKYGQTERIDDLLEDFLWHSMCNDQWIHCDFWVWLNFFTMHKRVLQLRIVHLSW